ncbi:MAG: hypothetical protein WB626_05540, partial [Bacteroidota bacterium]
AWRAGAALLAALAVTGCDRGIAPPETLPPAGIMTGTVTFLSWDSAGSTYDIRLVAFRRFPPTSILEEVLTGRAVVHPPVGPGSVPLALPDTPAVSYTVRLPPGIYPYVVVAQQFGPVFSSDWRPVGQYDLDSNLAVPSPVEAVAGDTTRNVDITVDFTRLPPPPFR